MSLLDHVNSIPTKWKDVILKFIEENPKEWLQIEGQINNLNVFPDICNIFKCFCFFNPEETRVVLMGQDPYHGPNQATGLCFGINDGFKIPPSLRNIKKELFSDKGIDLTDNSLVNWAQQGILMLNSSLSVKKGKPSSHIRFWLPFTKYIIQFLNDQLEGIVYLTWGAFAHKQVKDLVNWSKNKIVISSHPSPLSANKNYKDHPPFIGSKPFSKVNSLLSSHKHINW